MGKPSALSENTGANRVAFAQTCPFGFYKKKSIPRMTRMNQVFSTFQTGEPTSPLRGQDIVEVSLSHQLEQRVSSVGPSSQAELSLPLSISQATSPNQTAHTVTLHMIQVDAVHLPRSHLQLHLVKHRLTRCTRLANRPRPAISQFPPSTLRPVPPFGASTASTRKEGQWASRMA